MVKQMNRQSATIPCALCPLLSNDHFRDFSTSELGFVQSFKMGEIAADAGATILVEGTHSAHLFTMLRGWAFRYKTLEDGRRQIMNYILPGDLVGLQGSLMNEMQHTVETLTAVELCMFEKERLGDLYKQNPSLAFDVTWIASREEQMLDEHLLSIGRRSALERAAYLLSFLHDRARVTGAFGRRDKVLPLTQQHVADTLGLSLVHTNKTLKKLSSKGLIQWLDKGCRVRDVAELAAIAQWSPRQSAPRPFI